VARQFGGVGIDRISVVSIGLGERSQHTNGVKQLGFFGSIRDVDVALVRSDQFADEIRKSAVQSLAADNDELGFAGDFLGALITCSSSLFFTLNGPRDFLCAEGSGKRRSLPQLGRFLGFGRHDGDDAINGIFVEEGPPFPPKRGRGCGPSPDIPLEVSTRQGKNSLGSSRSFFAISLCCASLI
jgi:hypothetical protein